MGKRRCPVCRSREWHKEPSSGLITCSEGHVLQNYRNETNETTELGPHALHKRTLKSTRTVRARASKADDALFHGDRARYLYFECLQLLLRMQAAALAAAWRLPPAFETVCRDLWALHLSLLPRPPPAEPYFHAQGLGDDGDDDDDDDDDAAGPARPPSPSASDADGKPASASESDSDDKSSQGAEEAATLLADLLDEASQSESDAEDDAARKGVAALDRPPRSRYEVPAANVAVLMLACWTMRVPVMYLDLIRLIEAYTLPYLDPVRLLPPEMTCHLSRQTALALSPHFPPGVLTLHALTSRLARLCWTTYGIHTPEANAAPVLWRSVRALCGTSTLYALTKAVAAALALPLTLHPVLAPALVQARRTDPRRHKSDNIPAELALVGAATVVLKLVYGLDGTPRAPVDHADPACALPCLEDYLARLRDAAPGPDLVSARQHTLATELDDAQLDAYLAFCEHALLGGDVRDKTVAEFFALPTQQAGEGDGDPRGGPGDGHLRGTARPVAPGPRSGAVPPGSVVRVYNTLDVLGTVAPAYAVVLAAGADAVGVGADDVGRVVERFERRLVRWAERRKKQQQQQC